MLRGAAVVDEQHSRARVLGDVAARGVVGGGGRGEVGEPAAVEEHDDGEPCCAGAAAAARQAESNRGDLQGDVEDDDKAADLRGEGGATRETSEATGKP